MAPELLNAESGKISYTNKLDLWSIGICFYEMLYGDVPWDTSSLNELKEMVIKDSGKNLKFKAKPEISKEAKDLLARLIEADPNKRIEWKDFFNHPIFHKKETLDLNLKNSVVFRNNEDQVN